MNIELMKNLQKAREIICLVERGERELYEQQSQLQIGKHRCLEMKKNQRNSRLIGFYILGFAAIAFISYIINGIGIWQVTEAGIPVGNDMGIKGLLIFSIVGILGYTVCYVIWVIYKKQLYKNAVNKFDDFRDYCQNRYAVIAPSNRQLISQISFIPKQYQYETAISFFCMVIENGRAEALKECLNLYEEQLHRWKVEQSMYQISQAQFALNARINAVQREARMADITANFALAANLF